MAGPRGRRRLLRVVGRGVLVLALVVVGYGALVWWRHDRTVTLPRPDGRYAVGRDTATWTDAGRPDTWAPGSQPRRLSVWLWYPAARGGRRAPYAPGAWQGLQLPWPVGLGETSFDRVRTRAFVGAPVARGRFPVVVLEPGLGLAAPQYQALAEGLASHGYVVAGVTPTYSANLTVLDGHPVTDRRAGNPSGFSGGHDAASVRTAERLLRVWVADARFVRRRLTGDPPGVVAGHVDAGRVLYLGHSFGGAAALEACAQDHACVGAADLDGAEFGGVTRSGVPAPVLLVGHDGSCTTGACRARTADDRADRRVADRLLAHSRGPSWTVTLADSEHVDFTDYATYYLAAPLRRLVALGGVDGAGAMRLTAGVVAAFADHVARGAGAPLLAAGRHRVAGAVAMVRPAS